MEEKLIKIGEYPKEFNSILNINLPCLDIFQSKGLHKHIEKRHPHCLHYLNKTAEILKSPDYIGVNPKEPRSVELIKKYHNNVQVAVKLDKSGEYYYIASIYEVTPDKVRKHLKNGRLKKFELWLLTFPDLRSII